MRKRTTAVDKRRLWDGNERKWTTKNEAVLNKVGKTVVEKDPPPPRFMRVQLMDAPTLAPACLPTSQLFDQERKKRVKEDVWALWKKGIATR